MQMSGSFYLACCRMLATQHMSRVLINQGVSQMLAETFTSSNLWTTDQRIQMRTVLDATIYGLCDMAGLPRVDIPAEMAAAVIAMVVDPGNWMVAASMQAGHRPARDLAEPQETVAVERVGAGEMLTMIFRASAAMTDMPEYEALSERIHAKFSVKEGLIQNA